jgi:hypothetical protein
LRLRERESTSAAQSQNYPLPLSPIAQPSALLIYLSRKRGRLLRVLESVSFVQPNLEVVVRSLWEQVTDISPTSPKLEPNRKNESSFTLDYILSPEKQESVDTYQEQLESLWHRHEGGIVQFKYWIGIRGKKSSANRVPRLPALRATRQVHERLWYRPKR